MGLAILCFFFFFQAEDGIRDADVTGVQTCALRSALKGILQGPTALTFVRGDAAAAAKALRSEERRVGKECRSRWVADHEKKKKWKEGWVGQRVDVDTVEWE